jgi:hypothetical protein
MPSPEACEACSIAVSCIFRRLLTVELGEKSEARNPRRRLLQIRESSKSCGLCNFIASEIQKLTLKHNISNIEDDDLVVVHGTWQNYTENEGGACSRVLKSVMFQILGHEPGELNVKLMLGDYPVCIQNGVSTPDHPVLVHFQD